MTDKITASDITNWDSLQDIASSFEKRGLKPRPELGEENQLVLQIDDDEFIEIISAGPNEPATDFKPETRSRHTNLVATNDFDDFTFITRVRDFDQQHGRIKHQKLSFTKSQFEREDGEKNTILQKLNSLEYGSTKAFYDGLYDTQQIVEEFYEEFEDLRLDLVQEVVGIPDDRGDAKQRYVQVTLDRMIFLFFIQEKRLLDRNPEYLNEQSSEVIDAGGDVYDDFYEPLFFTYLAEDHQPSTDFGNIPYLNGGLFAKSPVEEEFSDAKLGASTEETNEIFDEILDFLSDWNWNVDERLDIIDSKNLSPTVLGHIFEQSVNQKEMGAYYTPEEITGFMSRETIHPYLLDELNAAENTDYEDIDAVFGFSGQASRDDGGDEGGSVMRNQLDISAIDVDHVETLYHDLLKDAHILDPAVGSGAFLLAAQSVLVDLYVQCIQVFEKLEKDGQGWRLSNQTRDELDTVANRNGPVSLYAKETAIVNNLYGVDIDDGAVEICKLRLWLSMVADIEDDPGDVQALPNIDFNIRQGNSLIGFTELMEVNDNGDASLASFGGGIGESVVEKYGKILEAVDNHLEATSSSEATRCRNLAESRLSEYKDDLNKKVLDDFRDAGVDDITKQDIEDYSPFHWVLEFATVYRDGGFDVFIGNPPWEGLSAYPDDYFSKYDEEFRTRSQTGKDNKMSEILEDDEKKADWEKYQQKIKYLATYYNNTTEYTLQSPKVDGRRIPNENDLSHLFFERILKISQSGAYISQILPGTVFSAASTKDLRVHALENTEVQSVIGFENNGIFPGIAGQYRFGVVTLKDGGKTDAVTGVFNQTNTSVLRELNETAFNVPSDVLTEYSPEAQTFPNLEREQEVSVLRNIMQHPPTSKEINNSWSANLYLELDRAKDTDRFVEDGSRGEYPIYQGKNIFQYNHNSELRDLTPIQFWSVPEDESPEKSAKRRIREKNFRSRDAAISLKKSIYNRFSDSEEFSHLNTQSQKGFVNDLLTNEFDRDELSLEDVLLDSTEYRIVLREVTNSTNERGVVAAVIPKGSVAVHTLHTIRPYRVNPEKENLGDFPMHSAYERVFSDKELFVTLGLLNSISFDYLMRKKLNTHISKYQFEESQMPRLTEEDDWFHYISERAARLNCYGEEFAEMRERLGGVDPVTDEQRRDEVRAEIDAAAFHAYGLDEDDVEFILGDFHLVDDPVFMTEAYLDMVREKYRQLAQGDPAP